MSSIDPSSDPDSTAETPSQPRRYAPPSSNRNILYFGLFMLAGIMFLAWIGRPEPVVTIGMSLPQLDLQPLLEGTPPVSRELLLGKIAVIHIWGTWCPPCKLEFPEFTKLAERFANNPNVAVVSISCSPGPEKVDLQPLREETLAFMSEFGASMPTYSDPVAMTRNEIALILPNGSLGYPTTLLVDREGKIFQLLNGYFPGDMEKLIPAIEDKLAIEGKL